MLRPPKALFCIGTALQYNGEVIDVAHRISAHELLAIVLPHIVNYPLELMRTTRKKDSVCVLIRLIVANGIDTLPLIERAGNLDTRAAE